MGRPSLEAQGCVPAASTALTATVVANTVMLSWQQPAGACSLTGYLIEAGSVTGASNIAVVPIGTATTLTATSIPSGTYYVRVRAVASAGAGAASNEVAFSVGSAPPAPCQLAPAAPPRFTARVTGGSVVFDWEPPPGLVTSYVLEAGSAPQLSNLASFDTGSAATTINVSAPPGTYYVRLRARNACGVGAASTELVVRVGPSSEDVEIIASDMWSHRLVRTTGMNGEGWSVGPSVQGRSLSGPYHLATDSAGRIYVADRDNLRIVRMDDLAGNGWQSFSGVAGTAICGELVDGLGCLKAIAVDASGRIYMTADASVIRINSMNGDGWTRFGPTNSGPGSFNNPKGIQIDGQGRIVVVDADRHRIVRFNDMQGTGWTTFGSFGSGIGQFNRPEGIALDVLGRIYITDNENHRIVRVDDLSGAGWTTFGSYGEGTGQFSEPHDIQVSPSMKIYIADTGNGRIVRIDDMSGAGWRSFGRRVSHMPDYLEFIAPKGLMVRPR